MHMADALVSPAVGGGMWAVSAGLVAYAAKEVQTSLDDRKVPLMGVLGAFIFSAQMINFAIPGTGSSGHLSGGLILAVLLGPSAGFLTIASVLTIQALFFADGGLLALGCNIVNIGFFSCFIAYPLIYKTVTRKGSTRGRIFTGSLAAAVVALQLGSFGVVVETAMSGLTELPFQNFALLMQLIHLAIGVVEGFITMTIIGFVRKARPELVEPEACGVTGAAFSIKGIIIRFAVAAVLTGGVLSWFASTHPDGLEWSILRVTGKKVVTASDSIHRTFARIQHQTAIFPDYSWGKRPVHKEKSASLTPPSKSDAGNNLPGLVGGGITLLMIGFIGLGLHWMKRVRKKTE